MLLPQNMSVRTAGRWLAGCLMFILLGISDPAKSANAAFAGGYNGTSRAAGMAMILEQDEDRIYGRIVDGQSNVFQISGQVNGNAVQGTLYNQVSSANFQLELKPTGLKFVIIPIVGGQPDLAAMKQLSFERGRITNPALADYRIPGPRSGDVVDILPFLESLRVWSKEEVATAYAGVADRYRQLIGQFDHLQADLMNRLCRARVSGADLAAISKGESLDCTRLTALFNRAEDAGTLQRFNEQAEEQRAQLYARVACERGLYAPSRCVNLASSPSAWQDASRIVPGFTSDRAQARFSQPAPKLMPPGPTNPETPLAPTAAHPRERPGLVAPDPSKRAMVSESELSRANQKTAPAVLPELDLTLRPSSGDADRDASDTPDPDEALLARVRGKMRVRPSPSNG